MEIILAWYKDDKGKTVDKSDPLLFGGDPQKRANVVAEIVSILLTYASASNTKTEDTPD